MLCDELDELGGEVLLDKFFGFMTAEAPIISTGSLSLKPNAE
jgi:hypothetical protein